MDVGAHLRSARERRGQTLEQVARATKLSLPVLRLIERNEWDGLPGGLLTRGHLRAYAAEVGLDPEDIVHEYLSQLPPPAVEGPPRRPVSIADDSPWGRHPALTALVAVALMIGAYRWLGDTPREPTKPTRAVAESPAESEPPVVRADEPDVVPAVGRSTAEGAPRLSLAIDVTGPCWVSARADGRLVAFQLFQVGDTLTVDANEELILRVGAPEQFRYTLNGVSGRSLGESGQPVTVRITEANLQSFLPDDARR